MMQQCETNTLNSKYTLDMMIDDFAAQSEFINGAKIRQWFDENINDFILDAANVNKIIMQIDKTYAHIKKNIEIKKRFLSSVINYQTINDYLLYAPLRQLGFYKNLVKTVLKMDNASKHITNNNDCKMCIVCQTSYSPQILLCNKYCQNINWFSMCQTENNQYIVCCFCLNKVYKYIKAQGYKVYELSQTLAMYKKLIRQHMFMKFKLWIYWWDFEQFIWRYANIIRIKNNNNLTIEVQIHDLDQINPCSKISIYVPNLPKHSFFIVFKGKEKINKIFDHEFEIDAQNEHIIGWTESSDAFTSEWQIPIVWKSKKQFPVYFKEIYHSVQLYNVLCDMNVL